MHLSLITIGKTKMPALRAGIEHFTKSISQISSFEYLELKDVGSDPEKEGKSLLAAIQKRSARGGNLRIVPLDVAGKQMSSEKFAQTLTRWQDSGAHTIIFIVGGAFGFSSEFYAKLGGACERLSLSPMVFTHELARLVLLEQIYRALHIQSGSKYHHS